MYNIYRKIVIWTRPLIVPAAPRKIDLIIPALYLYPHFTKSKEIRAYLAKFLALSPTITN